jgi:hypothetical protein
VNSGTERHALQRKTVPDGWRYCVAGKNGGPALKSLRRKDVSLLAVRVDDKSDIGAAIRIVLNRCDLAGNAGLVALEVDAPVEPLVTATLAANTDSTSTVSTGPECLTLGQTLLGLFLVQVAVVQGRAIAQTRRLRVVLLQCHHYAPSKIPIVSFDGSDTIAFFQDDV